LQLAADALFPVFSVSERQRRFPSHLCRGSVPLARATGNHGRLDSGSVIRDAC